MAPDKRTETGLDAAGALVTSIAALGVYLATIAPGLTFAHSGTDGGDLIAAAATLGVPHPTGYPTYTLLAWLATRLPLGTIAYRVNLLSAVAAAGAVAITYDTIRRLLAGTLHARLLAAGAVLTLAFASLTWSQAVIAEVYTLLLFFAALLMWLAVRWRQGAASGTLLLAALVLGIGLGNHVALLLMVPGAVLILWPERQRILQRPAILPAAIVLLLIGLSIYVYLPLAAAGQPPVNWGNPQTWEQLIWVVTGQLYHGYALALATAAIPERLTGWVTLLGDQFGWWGLGLVLLGAWCSWQRHRLGLWAVLAWGLLATIVFFFYDVTDSYIPLLPLLLPMAIAWGLGTGTLLEIAARRGAAWRRLATISVVLLPIGSLALHWQASDLSHDWSGEQYVTDALAAADRDALVMTYSDQSTFALWYGLYARRERPDVAVVNTPLLAFDWYRDTLCRLYPDLVIPPASTTGDPVLALIEQNLDRRPVYIADPPESWPAGLAWTMEYKAPLYRVR